MQRFKKPFLWLTLLSLVISLLPVGPLTPKASAADAIPTHFIPSIQELKNTFSKVMESGVANKEQINRTNVYQVTTPTITIEGTYKSGLSSTGMMVQVERLVQEGGNWKPDNTNVYSNGVTVLSDNTFRATDVTLFQGFNRITFSGQMGSTTKSESFYILYDKVPYLEELAMFDGGALGTPLNEGSPVITKEAMVSLEGTAQNVTTISVWVNGKNTSNVPRDEYSGKFYASGLSLAEGSNAIDIVMTNGSDTITTTRHIFRVTSTQAISSLYLYNGNPGATPYNAFNRAPVITENGGASKILGQVVIPYEHHMEGSLDDLKANLGLFYTDSATTGETPLTGVDIIKMNPFTAEGKVDTDYVVTPATSEYKEVIIADAAGTPQYFIVTFSATLPAANNGQNNSTIIVKYGAAAAPSFTTSLPLSFRYAPGKTTITELYHLPTFSETAAYDTATTLDSLTKVKLNGATVSTGTFYVLVESSNTPTTDLIASYLPVGSKKLDIKPATMPGNLTGAANQRVYKIEKFSAGQQQLSFRYGADGEESRATVSYVVMTKIAFTNLVYGQTYMADSTKTDLSLKIEGEYLGFENFNSVNNASSFVNGVPVVPTFGGTGRTATQFSIEPKISANGPLYFGENRIVFNGTTRDGNGNARTVTAELLIYIVDTNGSTISNFQPEARATQLLPSTTQMQPANDVAQKELDDIMSRLFTPSPTFTYDAAANAYTTNNKTTNLLVRGGGATRVKLYFGSTVLIDEVLTEAVTAKSITAQSVNIGNGNEVFDYALVGSQKDFVLRVEDLDIDVPGTYVYNLELINDSGSRTNKKLEIIRVVEPYRLLAPQPNLDGQYIVNKNFVHFDIEAEGATKVLIDKYEAVPSQEEGTAGRFVYDYVGLKPDKATKIKIQIQRADTNFTDTIEVYYTSAVNVDSQYMAEKVATKYTAFNKMIQLDFPKGTILQTANPGIDVIEYYPDNKLLFGIADPDNGAVGKQDDYGNYIDRSTNGIDEPVIKIPPEVRIKFASPESRSNFTRVSNMYWIHGGLGELGEQKSTNGLLPYSLTGTFTKFDSRRKIVPSQRGELTLAYDSSVVDEAGTTITVFRYTDSGIWENIGGEVDTKKRTITVPFDDFGYYTVMKLKRGYSDITNHGWARNILNGLYSKGIMKNLRGDSFGTDDRITRGEFATLLVKGLNIPLNYPKDGDHSKSTFTDVGPGAATETWSYKYIETAARAGIVAGTNEGEFAPYTPITREQAAVMIARALKLKLALNDDKLNSALAKSFTDSGSMDYYARPAIQAVSKAKIMNGTATTLPGQKKASYSFNPKGYMTRAEAGKIAVELFKKSTDIFPKNFN